MLILSVGDWLNTQLHTFLLWIDSVVYWFASQCYQLFIKLSSARIFDDSFFSDFADRIYAILGVVMLFYLAYALLTALIDPDKLTKGDKGVSKIATNLIVSLVILGFLPSIFDYAYRLQNFILSSNLIGSLILGTSPSNINTESSDAMLEYGDVLSFTVMNTFINSDGYNFNMGDGNGNNYTWYNLKADILENSNYSMLPRMADAIANGTHELTESGGRGNQVVIDYKIIFSTGAGIFLIYIMLSFTLDLGIRVVKFAVCQLLAPIPVIMRILPSKKGVFDKWLKQTLSIYFEVFVRVAIMYFVVYFINAFLNSQLYTEYFAFSNAGIQGMLAGTIIILGTLAFAKQAPKMISDMLGINTGGLKLGIGEKIKGSLDGLNSLGAPGKFVHKTGGKAVGAITGGLGAGVSSFANGAGFGAGFMFGAANGWNSNGGMQFNKQRQSMYSKITGDMKGKASYFGGTTLGTKINTYMTKQATDNAKKNREAIINAFERPVIQEEQRRQVNEFNEAKQKAISAFNLGKQTFEADKNHRINALEAQYNKEKSTFETNKQSQLKELSLKAENARRNNDVLAMSQIKREIDSLTQSSYQNDDLLAQKRSIMAEEYHNEELENIINSEFVLDEKAISKKIEEVRKEIKSKVESKDKEFKATRDEKKYHAKVKESNTLNDNATTSAQKKAFEQVIKDLGYKKEDKK